MVATFALDGPTRCSGLDLCRYGPEELHREFGGSFEHLAHLREQHITPSGARQGFSTASVRFALRTPPQPEPLGRPTPPLSFR
jgi:hypothetical protein